MNRDGSWRACFLMPAEMRRRIYGTEEVADLAVLAGAPLPEWTGADLPAGSVDPATEAVFSGWGMPRLDEAALARLPALRIVFYGAGSVRGFVTEAMWDRGVRVVSAAGENAVPVAEFAFAQVVLALKQAMPLARLMRTVRGRPREWPVIHGAYRSTVGLVSLGLIGRRMAERLATLDVEVLAHDPGVTPEAAAALGVTLVGLEELFARSHVVSCHTPWLPETEAMIGRELLGAMPAGASFINTARGAVVNEAELVQVMRQRPDLTAYLDVTWPEPPVAASELYDLPNVYLTPHVAGSTGLECERMGRGMVDEARRWRAGRPLTREVTRERAASMA